MKLERDHGARLEKHSTSHYIGIESVRDLMLTKKTKLFKAGLFFKRADFEVDFDGYVCDNQISYEATAGIARFFLDMFLGCSLADDPTKTTKEFFEVTKEYIQRIVDPIRKATYQNHLISYMNRPSGVINPEEFAASHFEDGDLQSYSDHLRRKGFEIESFEKNNELIKSQIRAMTIKFENEISIVSHSGALADRVTLTDEGDGITKAEVRSRITKID